MIRNLVTIIAAAFLLTLGAPSASADKGAPSKSAKAKKGKKAAPSKGKKAAPSKGSKARKGKKAAPSKGKARKGKKARPTKGKKSKPTKGKSASNAQPKKAKSIVFGVGDELEGSLDLPSGDDHVAKGNVGHSSLIKTRAHFIPEILKQAEKL